MTSGGWGGRGQHQPDCAARPSDQSGAGDSAQRPGAEAGAGVQGGGRAEARGQVVQGHHAAGPLTLQADGDQGGKQVRSDDM